MDTAPLKSFATWARTALIREVTARIAVVLAPASPQRVEQPKAVAALEKAITTAGGGEKGRGAVADRVAYTWFNRIIGLRFMDANGYTGTGVVSPQAGVGLGQPEILAEAKRANIDPEVVSPQIRELVSGLLNGTRRSDDPQSEAYALLLVEYCRHWNRAMPFMFERQGDFTELLVPANLLADDSVLNRAVKALTDVVCQDVEVVGWLYQFYISERKDEVFAGFKKNKKAGAVEIPAATQLFTPDWIVRYLVENSIGRLWMLNHPMSSLIERMRHYVTPIVAESNFLKIKTPKEVKVIDPACGSGHMLTYAFDLLYAIYEEEGYAPSEIPGLILTNNLHGVEIDPRAGALAAFALTMKARQRYRRFFDTGIQPNITVVEPIAFSQDELDRLVSTQGDRAEEEAFWNQFEKADLYGALICPDASVLSQLDSRTRFGAADEDLLSADVNERAARVLSQAKALASKYTVLIANPPYMGSANMGSDLASFVSSNFKIAKADLMTAFMVRAEQLTCIGGRWGMINIPTWMFLGAFEKLRVELLANNTLDSLLHLGRGVFGADFGSVAYVFERSVPGSDSCGVYRRLFEEHVAIRSNEEIEDLFLSEYGVFVVQQRNLIKLPGSQFAYWAQQATLEAFSGPQLSTFVTPRTGIDSGNNALHYRYWYEVSYDSIRKDLKSLADAGSRFYAYAPVQRGGERRRWFGNVDSVVSVGESSTSIRNSTRASLRNSECYFQEAVTWNRLSNGRFYPRKADAGTAFDDLSPFATVLPPKSVTFALGLMASKPVRHFLGLLNQGRKTEVGHVAALPAPVGFVDEAAVEARVERLVEIARTDWNRLETSLGFAGLPGIGDRRFDSVESWAESLVSDNDAATAETKRLELENDRAFIDAYGLAGELEPGIDEGEITLVGNPLFRYGSGSVDDGGKQRRADLVKDLISYSVGCMFGRYSPTADGPVLAEQGSSLDRFFSVVPVPSFSPDQDNVIPVVDGEWFEDEIVAKFRLFLRITFGENYFEENIRFITESLGVKDLRSYFLKHFYKDHVQRYKNRPIYWLFSSPHGSFNALIYMHRYTPSTVSTVLNEYLREFKAKLEATLGQQEQLAAGEGTPRQQAVAQKEADRIRKILLELDEYEHDVLYPLASQQIEIDLDDGVRINYPKFGAALKKIPGLEASE